MTDPEPHIVHVADNEIGGGLYNAIFPDGLKRAAILLPAIGLNPKAGAAFRVRDAWVEKDGLGRLFIHVYTRVGGGNRERYAKVITEVRRSEYYERDADDRFDSTYASFWFRVPDQFCESLRRYAVDPIDPAARWEALFAKLRAQRSS